MGEKDTNTMKQIEMPGFEAPKLPQYKSALSSEEKQVAPPETSPKKHHSILEIIKDIQIKPNYAEDVHETKPYQVKTMDQETWIHVRSKEEGQAVSFFLYLTEEQNLNVKKIETLSSHLFSPDQDKREATLEEVGVYLFSEYENKAKNRDLNYREIQEGIDYCLDERNRLTIKAMVQENRGIELPSHYHD